MGCWHVYLSVAMQTCTWFADLHMAQLMPLPLTVSCFSKIQIGFTFLVPAHPGSPGQKAVKRVCVCKYKKDQRDCKNIVNWTSKRHSHLAGVSLHDSERVGENVTRHSLHSLAERRAEHQCCSGTNTAQTHKLKNPATDLAELSNSSSSAPRSAVFLSVCLVALCIKVKVKFSIIVNERWARS